MSSSRKYAIGIAAAIAAIVLSGSAQAGLVDHYEFEGDGVDSAGGDANGTVGSSVTFGPGAPLFDQAAVFVLVTTEDNRITVPLANAFAPGMSDFSIAFWVKRDENDSGIADMDGVFDALRGGTVGYQAYFANQAWEDHLIFRLDDDTGAMIDVRSQDAHPDTTAWHHYALTVDRTADLATIWVDGVADPGIDISVLTSAIVQDQDLRIGIVNGAGGLDGGLDDLRFYNHKLEQSEVEELYSPTTTVCGDSVIDDPETCDDGNAGGGDGCSAGCQVESGYDCTGEPSVCTDIDECLGSPCDVNAACTNLTGSFTCECNEGYVGDGFTCVMLDLIDHYDFENDGIDSAGGDANGTVGDNVSFAPGVTGQAAVFGLATTEDNRITVPLANAFAPGMSDFSIAFWVKRDENDSGIADMDGVFDALRGGTVGYQAYFANQAWEDHLVFRLDDDTGAMIDVRSQDAHPDTTAWHHYALTVDRTADLATIWVDGVADPAIGISVLTSAIVQDQDLRIGIVNSAGGLDGKLDDLRFYNYVLDDSEVQELATPPAVCGDGVTEGAEECDDGNTTDGDCCDSNCMYEAEFSACGDQDDTGCNVPDSCDGAGSCIDHVKPDTYVCRAGAGECDVEELCDGTTYDCPADEFEAEFTACGDADDTDCNAPDSCDGAGDCVDRVKPDTYVCRADAGDCDIEELCDGSTYGCPVDGFEVEFTACGDADDTDCNAPDSCDGAGDCVDHVKPDTDVCRADAGECDIEELCDGSTYDCPVDDFEAEFTACGDADDTDCNAPDSCDDAGGCIDRLKPTTHVCRADTGACDIEELCDGSTHGCPVDGSEVEFTACGDGDDTDCNAPDSCDAAGGCIDRVKPDSHVCRADAGDCDIEELCDGSAYDCPADEFEAEFTACGDADDTDCNAPDSCDGVGGCVDHVKADTYVCRADAGECDVEELCDGSAHECPADGFDPEFTACGDADDTDCNAPNSCDGAGMCVDWVKADTYVCRADAGECDVEEFCDGSTYDCPFDAKSTDVCRGSTDECDPSEACDGVGDYCPDDVTIVDCIDDDGCCVDGCNANNDSDCDPLCGNGIREEGEVCDDGNDDETDFCTTECTYGQAIPAVSTWGMVVLTLLLVGAMASRFGRRSRAA